MLNPLALLVSILIGNYFRIYFTNFIFPDNLEVATAVDVSVWSWYNISLCIDLVLIFFQTLVLQEFSVQTESRILLKPVLWSVRIVALSISFMNRLNKTECAVFFIVGSFYFQGILFSRLFRGRNSCRCFCVNW